MLLDVTWQAERSRTAARLFGWHTALFPTRYSGPYPVQISAWRTGPMQVVAGSLGRERVHDYEAPPADDLDGQLLPFLAWFNADRAWTLCSKRGWPTSGW